MKIFVYGTLKKGFKNHYLLEDSEFIKEHTTKYQYPMIDSGFGYPYLINKPGIGKKIKGEIYEISDTVKGHLDILEDAPRYYYLGDIDGFKTYFKTKEISIAGKYLLDNWL